MHIVPSGPHRGRRGLLAAAAAMPFSSLAQTLGLPRVALVIGNAAYAAGPLLNPGRDAAAVSARLRALGFQVIERRDANRPQMAAALAEAAAALRGRQGVGLLYYAGHGLQIDWRNLMLPVDARIDSAADALRQGFDVQEVLEAFREAGTRTHIVVLDACRDNPFGSAASGRGLAPLDAPPGSFLAYATAPGHVADDGDATQGNGLYTHHLLRALQQPEAPIEELFKRVRTQVRRASGGRQIPWESTSLEEDFAFASGARLAAPGPAERDALFEAQRRDWERIRASGRVDDFFAFLQQHPVGVFAELAQAAIDRLSRPQVVPQPVQELARVLTLPPGADRFRLGDRWEAEVVNHLDGDRRTRHSRTVTDTRDGVVTLNHGEVVVDQLGSVLKNHTGRKDPGMVLAPSQLCGGMRWGCDFDNRPEAPGAAASRHFYDYRVRGIEAVALPLGRLLAYHVVGGGRAVTPNAIATVHSELWIEPETMWVVKQVWRRTPQGARAPDVHETTAMVARSRVAR
jgi:hypothetical protein